MTNTYWLEIVSHNFDKKSLKISSLFINNKNKLTFTEFKENSVASFKNVLIKVLLDNNSEVYFILSNAFMTFIENKISIKHSGQIKTFKIANNSEFLKSIEQELNKEKTSIKYIKALNDLDLDKSDVKDLKYLKNKIFEHNAILNFSLEKSEVLWD